MKLLLGKLLQRFGQWAPSIEQDLSAGRENPNPDEFVGEQLRDCRMFSFFPTDRHLHRWRLEVPAPRDGAVEGTLLDAVRFDPVGKTSRQTADQ